jgi:hypothetical protein
MPSVPRSPFSCSDPRRALALALAVSLAASLATLAAGAAAAAPATLAGGVDVERGDDLRPRETWVLAQPADATAFDDLALDRDPHEGFLRLARGDADGVFVTRTTDGEFALDVPERGAYDVVAVSPEGLSRVRTVEANGTTRLSLTLDAERVGAVDAERAVVAPGGTVEATVTVRNPDADEMAGVELLLAPAPRDTTLRAVRPRDGGDYYEGAGVVRWESVPPNGSVSVALSLAVEEDADRGPRPLEVGASARTHALDHTDDVELVVRPANATTTRTTTPLLDASATATTTDERAPGLGVAAALSALLAVALLARRTRR